MYQQISSNKWKSYFLIFFFIAFIFVLGYIFGFILGSPVLGAGIAFVIAIAMALFSYYKSDSIALKISGAREVKREEFPHLFHTVEGLAIAAGIPKPRVYVIDDPAMNAFATGRDPKHSVICVTTGLLNNLDRAELEGVIAHEMSHIKNYDIRIMTLVVVLVGLSVLLGHLILRTFIFGGHGRDRNMGQIGIIFLVIGLLFAVLSPFIAQIIKLAISRKREYLADADGALLTRYPEGLASALEKISKNPRELKTANNATAHLFISNPFKGKSSFMRNLFSTHPPVEKRIKALREM